MNKKICFFNVLAGLISLQAAAAPTYFRPGSLVTPKMTQTARDALSSPTAGLLIYNTTSNKANIYNGASWVDVGSGSGGVNYITGGDAESGTSGFSSYADAAGALPVDGTGGAPTHISISTSGSAPLDGSNSFLISNSGSTSAQGEGISVPFTISTADEAKVLQVSFTYIVNSGTFVAGTDSITGDANIYLYDVTNAQVIQPAGFKLTCSSTTISCSFSGTFQAASNSVSYRLIWHVAGTNTSAWTLKLDRISVSPVNRVFGGAITDWTPFTMSITGGVSSPSKGTAVENAQMRRVGGNLEIRYDFVQSVAGGPGSGNYLFNIPGSLQIDSSKVNFGSNQYDSFLGPATLNANSDVSPAEGHVAALNSTQLVIVSGSSIVGSTFYRLDNGTVKYHFSALIPILGWATSTQLSSDSDARVVAMEAKNPTSSATGGYTTVIFGTVSKDTHSAYNASTGVYTVAVPGLYLVSGKLQGNGSAGSQLDGYILKNGVTQIGNFNGANGNVNGGTGVGWSSIQPYNSGDTIQIQALNSASGPTWTGGGYSYLNVSRLAGPEQIAATETVALQVGKTTAQSISNTTITDLTSWDAPAVDSHGIFNASTGIATIQVPGKYLVMASAAFASNATGFRMTRVSQNGNTVFESSAAAFGNDGGASVSGVLNCLSGDTIKVSGYQTSGGPLNTSTATGYTRFSLLKQGN